MVTICPLTTLTRKRKPRHIQIFYHLTTKHIHPLFNQMFNGDPSSAIAPKRTPNRRGAQANLLGFGLGSRHPLLPQHSHSIPVAFCHLYRASQNACSVCWRCWNRLESTSLKYTLLRWVLEQNRAFLREVSASRFAKALFVTRWRTVT